MSEDRSAIKETRTTLRRIITHLQQAHLNLGAQIESPGYVEIIHHESSPLSTLNYVTPRRQTAWVPDQAIADALEELKSRGRRGRVQFAEGLFLPVFARSLRNMGLEIERELPLMVYKKKDPAYKVTPLSPEIKVTRVSGQQGMSIWWYVWRNAYYDVVASGIEPLMLGQDLRAITLGDQIDLIMYRHGFPVGVARLTLHEKSAHLIGYALMREVNSPEMEQLLRNCAMQAAFETDCDMIFTIGETDEARHQYREMGFIDTGSILCYAEPLSIDNHKEPDDALEPVLVL